MERISHLGHSLVKWQIGASTFLALPEKGARLMNWSLTLGDGSVRDILYWPELKSLEGFARVRGGNPILFPFCARTFDRGDPHFWRAADGIRRPMPMHGLARQGDFKVTRLDPGGFSALFVPGPEAREAYPYDYEFTVNYRFEALGLFVELALKNLDRIPLPWSAGHHFYFTVPWSDGLGRTDYTLKMPAAKTLRQTPHGLLSDGPHLAAEEPLANRDLPDTFHTALRSRAAVLTEKPTGSTLTVRVGTARVPPKDTTFVTWTPADDAPCYCLEPWMGPPNAPETNVGLHHVAPGETQTFLVEVSLQ